MAKRTNRGAWRLAFILVGLILAQVSWGGLIALGEAPDPFEVKEQYDRSLHHFYLIGAAGLLGLGLVGAGLLWGLSDFLKKI
jgi:hypothetical protein